MATEVTISKLRNKRNLEESRFLYLYEKLVTSSNLPTTEMQELLSFAVVFLKQGDETVQKLGYRIVLQYSLSTHDYEPLLDLSDQREIMPIVDAISRTQPEAIDHNRLKYLMSEAHRVNFFQGGIVRTREQLALQQFNKDNAEVAVIAPTSYGKSEMMVARALASMPAAVCIIVPSKALIAQTKVDIVRAANSMQITMRVISHPEAYNQESDFIGILTQERLHRLFVDNPQLKFDQILVDEAQNILSDDIRSVELSQVVLIARNRNPQLQVAYYTPFLEEPERIHHVNDMDHNVRSRSVVEQVKAERFYFGETGGSLRVFDQYLSRSFEMSQSLSCDEADAVMQLAGDRTIVYVNKPRHAQELALRIAQKVMQVELSPLAQKAIQAISELIDNDYVLVEVIRRGVLFHHGQIPDVLRQYVENLFREDSITQKRYLVTTSTLLEGVNTPADTMVMMSAGKGRGNLVRSSFRNLIGRVARFSQIFSSDHPNLSLLLPKIYLIKNASYSNASWNPLNWLKDHADPSKEAVDPVLNPLLARAEVSEQTRFEALERLENIEEGSSNLEHARRAITRLGRLCFQHGAYDFDIFKNEVVLQERIDDLEGQQIQSTNRLVELICSIFLTGVELLGKDLNDIERLRDEEPTKRFYSMFLDWRASGAPMKLMIGRYLKYWNDQESDLIWVGSRWGDVKKNRDERVDSYVQRSQKSHAALVNLAIVRIKAEVDFLDYRLMKYIEILNSLELLDQSLYLKLKYGTDDRIAITLLRNGMSLELVKLIRESYMSLVHVNVRENVVEFREGLLEVMERDGANDVLLFEVRGLVGSRP